MKAAGSGTPIEINELIGFLYKFDRSGWEKLQSYFPQSELAPGKKLGGSADRSLAHEVRVGLSVSIEALNSILDQADKVILKLQGRLQRDGQWQFWGLLMLTALGIVGIFVPNLRFVSLVSAVSLTVVVLVLHIRIQFSPGQRVSILTAYYQLMEKRAAAEYLQRRLLLLARHSVADHQMVEAVRTIEKANYLSVEIRRLLDQLPFREPLSIASVPTPALPSLPPAAETLDQATVEKVRSEISNARTKEAIHLLMEYYKGSDSEKLHDLIVLSARLKQYQRARHLGLGESTVELNRINSTILDLL